jgi:phosphatidylcholine synthase
MAARVVDGIDGTLARALQVRERLPRIDGEARDLIVDYLNYALVPALLIWRAKLLPEGLAFPLASLIMLSSLYVFACRDMKTEDGCFRGFPALWNVVAAYLLVIRPMEWVSAAVICTLVVLTFSPVLVILPFRARE